MVGEVVGPIRKKQNRKKKNRSSMCGNPYGSKSITTLECTASARPSRELTYSFKPDRFLLSRVLRFLNALRRVSAPPSEANPAMRGQFPVGVPVAVHSQPFGHEAYHATRGGGKPRTQHLLHSTTTTTTVRYTAGSSFPKVKKQMRRRLSTTRVS